MPFYSHTPLVSAYRYGHFICSFLLFFNGHIE
jgi:hypothetical protein